MKDFTKGRDSLFQAIALMRDDEEFQRNYGKIPSVISSGRESSISLLCHMITRMKSELDSNRETKLKCIELLDGIACMWSEMLKDRQKMSEKISSLEKEVGFLREALALQDLNKAINTKQVAGTSAQMQPERSSMQPQMTEISFSNSKDNNSTEPSQSLSKEENNETNCSGFDANSNFDQNGFSSQLSSQPVDFTHPLLTRNPYDSLDISYYNPAQFFQRQSTTSVFKKRGGTRGGIRKKSTTPTSSVTKPKPKRKPKALKPSAIEIVVDLDLSEDPNETKSSENAVEEGEVAKEQQRDESPDPNYFDYTSTFLDDSIVEASSEESLPLI